MSLRKTLGVLFATSALMVSSATVYPPQAAHAEEVSTGDEIAAEAEVETSTEAESSTEATAETDAETEDSSEANSETEAPAESEYEPATNLAAGDEDAAIDDAAAEYESAEEGLSLQDSSQISTVTGAYLGDGFIAYTTKTIDQTNVKKDALACIKKWHQDALNDTSVKFKYNGTFYTTREYLKKIGKTENEYLNPKWSIWDEKVTVQRAVEARTVGYAFGHKRPNGTYYGENVLAWGTSTVTGAIEMWCSEKSQYTAYCNGNTSYDFYDWGHYYLMVLPDVAAYGFGGAEGCWAGSISSDSDDSEVSTNWKGTYDFEVALSDDEVAEGVTWSGSSSLSVGKTESYKAIMKWNSDYFVKGTWSSSNTSVATVDQNGNVKGISSGSTTITLKSQGKTYIKDITVKEVTWTRLAGEGRYDTMKAISSKGWSSSDTVIIASGGNFPDALAASSLAGQKGCPILLTDPSNLSSQTSAEIKRLSAKTAYIVGGPAAVSKTVESQIKKLGCSNIKRLYGNTRQDTARAIAAEVLKGSHSSTCIIATSSTFADALSISPYAYAAKAPIYLAEGDKALSSTTINAIKSAGYTNIIVVGGYTALPFSGIERKFLQSEGSYPIYRLYGETRYETSSKIAEWSLKQGLSASSMAVATGQNFADALAGAALCGKNESVLLLAENGNTSAITGFGATQKGKVTSGYVFGGVNAVSDSTFNLFKNTCK